MGDFKKNSDRIVLNIYDGVEIFDVDLSYTSEIEYIATLHFLKDFVEERLPQKTLLLVNSKNSSTTPKSIEETKKVVIAYQQNVSISATYNLGAFSLAIIKLFNLFSFNKLMVFPSKDLALKYLLKVAKDNLD